ncbi:serine/threonine-protein phosphatase 7 long form-like protein [Iris pallida]|uniref:Serine/threonine-protein phosphatase 7 long form-like protein n=1 Tax=Iris pallida TaxID=29817 RepID=A0AAX6FIW6_IRIPA|nr:serine/threonine-protein phosphatase 7 long form-like protein [Iris pallida]
MEYLGVEPPKLKGKSLVTFSWLRRNFMHLDRIDDDEEVSVDENQVISCTRVYLLGLISAVVFSDSSDMVNLPYLPFLEDLTTPTRHAWGTSMLAYLYNSMSDFVRVLPDDKIMKNLNGCMTLIQVWSYEHFSIGRLVTGINSNAGIFPLALRWTTAAVDPAHCVHSSASIYRGQFDTLKYTEVKYVYHSVIFFNIYYGYITYYFFDIK